MSAQLPGRRQRALRLLAMLAAGQALTGGATPATDVVYANARIHTMDAANTRAEALAVRQGRILAVGTRQQVRAAAAAGAREVDLGGATVLPGFIENHIHMIRAAQHWEGELRLDGIASRAQALARLRAHAARLPADAWVYTFGGFSPWQFADARQPFSASELDQAAGGRPVYLQLGFQGALVNAAAATRAGLSAPPQEVLFAMGDGMERIRQTLLATLPAAGDQGARAISWQAARYGITTALDMAGFGIRDEHYAPFRQLAERCALPLRMRYTRWFANAPSRYGHGEEVFERELRLRVPGAGTPFYKLFGAGELLYLPMQDAVGHPGSSSPADLAKLESIYARLAARKWPMKVHAEDPATIANHLDVIERVHRKHPVDGLHWGFEHADGITAQLLARMRRLGMSVGVHSRPLLASAAAGAAVPRPPLRTIADSGVLYGLGSDALMVNGFAPLKTIQWAVTGRALDGSVVTSQRLTRLEALRAHTIHNARLLGEERELGSLEPGKWADFVVLDADPLQVPERKLGEIAVRQVYLAGTRLDFERRQVDPAACAPAGPAGAR